MTEQPGTWYINCMDRILRVVFLGGLALLTLSVIILFTTIGSPESAGVLSINREIRGRAGDEVFVRTKISVNEQDRLATFPSAINRWQNSNDYSDEGLRTYLDADAYIRRAYTARDRLSQPFYLLVLYARFRLQFPSPRCLLRV
jgi:hypothetical protein